MARLSTEVRRFIVVRLACFDSLTQIAAAVKETFGIVITRQQVQKYDPVHGEPGRQWIELYHATRASELAAMESVAASHRIVRLRRLDRMSQRAEESRNYKLSAALLEQAAKEMGGFYAQHAPGANTTEEEQITRIKAALAVMDERTIGPAIAPSVPALTLEKSA